MREPGFLVRAVAPFAVVVALSGTSSRVAHADAGADLDAGDAAYASLDYDKALALAQKVVATHGLNHDKVVRGYRLLGRTYAVLGKGQQAIEAFEKLLTYAPDEKPDLSQTPRIQEAFSEAQGFWAGYPTKPGLDATTVALRVHAPGTLRVRLHDPTHQVKSVVIGYRWGGMGAYTTSEQKPADTINVDIPPGPATVSRFDFYVDALDSLDDQAFSVGDPAAPQTVFAEAPPVASSGGAGGGGAEQGGHSIFASPVFWSITGVVVAGAVTSAYFITRKPTDVTQPPTGANLVPSLFCGNTSDGHCH